MNEERKFNLSVDIKEKKKSGTVLMTEGSIWKKLPKLPYSPMIKATTDNQPTKRRLYGI